MQKSALAQEKIWFDKPSYDKAERLYFEKLAKAAPVSSGGSIPAGGSLAREVAKARQHIIQSLQCVDDIAAVAGVTTHHTDNKDALDIINGLKEVVERLEARVKVLEDFAATLQLPNAKAQIAVCPAKLTPPPEAATKDDDDEDIDLFGSDSEGEDADAAKIREERLAAYTAKKATNPALIAKSSIILDVKPWDDTTDMALMEAEVRKIEMTGLLWGAAKLVPLAYGIHKLQICCVVEDDKVSIDELTEKIQDIEEYVQSVDIAAFNKV